VDHPAAILSGVDAQVRGDDGGRLWASVVGDGAPLVLCHGGPGMWDYFGDVAGMLAGDARVIRWDQRGCGRSERRGPYTVARCVADLDAVRERLARPRTALLGHSWGAELALRYTLEHPGRVSGLIYVSGNGIDRDHAWHPHYQRNRSARLGKHRDRWAALDNRDRTAAEEREWALLQLSVDYADGAAGLRHAADLATPWLGINHECNRAVMADYKRELAGVDFVARCRALDVPVLIVDGPADIRPRWSVDSLHEALPHVERVSLTGAAHLPWVEDPEGFRRSVAGFLAKAAAART
jgi:proline iminopeptidase